MRNYGVVSVALGAVLFLSACATRAYDPAMLRGAKAPVWSLKTPPGGMSVALSPAGSTLRLAGSYGMAIGVSVNAVVNDRHRKAVEAALQDYDTTAALEQGLRDELQRVLGASLRQGAPLTTTAGFNTERDAEAARRMGLARNGGDLLLDLKAAYGLFGPEALLAAKMEGKLVTLPEGQSLWTSDFLVTRGALYANDDLKDPTKTMKTDFDELRLSVDEEAVAAWTANGGEQFKSAYGELTKDVAAALLCALGLEDSARGRYVLGVNAIRQKEYEEAETHLARAIELEPGFVEAQNARAVNAARSGNRASALEIATGLTKSAPEAPAPWFNAAWWLAEEGKASEAQGYYDKALSLGAPKSSSLEKLISKAEKERTN